MSLEKELLEKMLSSDRSLLSINLKLKVVTDDSAVALRDALKKNDTLVSLDLTMCQIRDIAVKALSDALYVNRTLTSLNLSGNYIEEVGTEDLSKTLGVNSTLTYINLSMNSIRDVGANYLSKALKANHTLLSIKLSGCDIESAGAQALSDALKVNQALQELDLTSNKIGDKGITSLSGALKVNRVLTSLGLRGNEIELAGAKALSEALKINRSLTSISLNNCKIDDEGAAALSEGLKINRSLTHIYLYGNNIGSAGTKALSDALKENQIINLLALEDKDIGADGIQALRNALKNNYTLQWLPGISDDKEIEAYLERNKAIAGPNILGVIADFFTRGEFDGQKIQDAINALVALVPEVLSQEVTLLEDSAPIQSRDSPMFWKTNVRVPAAASSSSSLHESYSTQCYRLLKGIGQLFWKTNVGEPADISSSSSLPESYPRQCYRLLNGLGHLSAQKVSIPETLSCFLMDFANPQLQTFANMAFGRLVMVESISKQLFGDALGAFYQLALWKLRHHLDNRDMNTLVLKALYNLRHPLEEYKIDDRDTLSNSTVIMNVKMLQQLVKQALRQCEGTLAKQNEIALLEEVLKHQDYHPAMLDWAFRSPTVMALLKKENPNQTYLTLIEHTALNPQQDRIALSKIPSEVNVEEITHIENKPQAFHVERRLASITAIVTEACQLEDELTHCQNLRFSS